MPGSPACRIDFFPLRHGPDADIRACQLFADRRHDAQRNRLGIDLCDQIEGVAPPGNVCGGKILRNLRRCRPVAGCSHISVFIAGASNDRAGPVPRPIDARQTVVRQSERQFRQRVGIQRRNHQDIGPAA